MNNFILVHTKILLQGSYITLGSTSHQADLGDGNMLAQHVKVPKKMLNLLEVVHIVWLTKTDSKPISISPPIYYLCFLPNSTSFKKIKR